MLAGGLVGSWFRPDADRAPLPACLPACLPADMLQQRQDVHVAVRSHMCTPAGGARGCVQRRWGGAAGEGGAGLACKHCMHSRRDCLPASHVHALSHAHLHTRCNSLLRGGVRSVAPPANRAGTLLPIAVHHYALTNPCTPAPPPPRPPTLLHHRDPPPLPHTHTPPCHSAAPP